MIRVAYFQRKPIPNFHFSVEIIFNDVRKYLPGDIDTRVIIAKYFSKGILKRLYIMGSTFFQQGDINHITGDISFAGILLSRKRTVQTILDCIFLKNQSGISRKILKLFWLDLPVRRARVVTTISHQVKSEIIQLTGCSEQKVQVIPIALSDVFNPRVNKPISSPPRILLIGSAPNKNLTRCLEVLRSIDCEIHVVAKQEANYTEQLESMNRGYRYESGLNQKQMLEKYKDVDLLVFASTYEGFGMPIIEAQAVGVPVITSNVSSMPEVAGDGAHLVDPFVESDIKAGILKVLKDSSYRNDLIQKGFQNVKRFDAVNIANQYATIYRSIYNKTIINF